MTAETCRRLRYLPPGPRYQGRHAIMLTRCQFPIYNVPAGDSSLSDMSTCGALGGIPAFVLPG